MATTHKSEDAFRTIGELSQELGVAQHILRYWETKFPQLRPLQRAGNRRYYRPDDVALAKRINSLLNQDGYTIRGVQKLLREKQTVPAPTSSEAPPRPIRDMARRPPIERLMAIRDKLTSALELT